MQVRWFRHATCSKPFAEISVGVGYLVAIYPGFRLRRNPGLWGGIPLGFTAEQAVTKSNLGPSHVSSHHACDTVRFPVSSSYARGETRQKRKCVPGHLAETEP